jgi:polar amino acid transport system permease protein
MRYVILPQALRIAVPPTVGFLVQLVKATALASIVGFNELTRAGHDRDQRHLPAVAGLRAGGLDLFLSCAIPLTLLRRMLERKLSRSR